MLHASRISISAAPIVHKTILLSPDVDLPRCGECMQRMHAVTGKTVEKNTAIGAPCKYCGASRNNIRSFPRGAACGAIFEITQVVLLTSSICRCGCLCPEIACHAFMASPRSWLRESFAWDGCH